VRSSWLPEGEHGGQKAVDPLIEATARRKVDGVRWREKVAEGMLADDDQGHTWPPPFVTK
jgi:hypothetical protein